MTYKLGKTNPMSLREADQALYGKPEGESVDVPGSGRLVAKPTSIFTVWPDLRQPRRAIPMSVRGTWDGDPIDIPGLLEKWALAAAHEAGKPVDVIKLLMSHDSQEFDVEGAILNDFLDLVGLAASIQRDGLLNAITTASRGGRTFVVTGERRLLSYHLLALYMQEDKYGKIAAREMKDEEAVWAQAAENGARKPLNAVGMARQLALLIMNMYERADGVDWGAFESVVLPGECDRKFYAQVADGNRWRIKKGFMQRILDVTGLKSKTQIAQYRALLDAPDDLWMLADVKNWTENGIRLYTEALRKPDTLTGVNLSEGDRGMGVSVYGEESAKNAQRETPTPTHSSMNEPHPPTPPRTQGGEQYGAISSSGLPRLQGGGQYTLVTHGGGEQGARRLGEIHQREFKAGMSLLRHFFTEESLVDDAGWLQNVTRDELEAWAAREDDATEALQTKLGDIQTAMMEAMDTQITELWAFFGVIADEMNSVVG